MVLLQGTFLVSNGNNIVTCNFAYFVANDVKGPQMRKTVKHAFSVLYSDKTWVFDQSEHAQGAIYILI